MKISAITAAAAVLSSLLVLACDPASPDPEPIEDTGASTTSPEETDTSTTSTTSMQTESGAETEEPATSSTSGAPPIPATCEDATTPEECEAASDEVAGCGWFPTTRFTLADGTCELVGTAGVCLLVDRLDGCDESFAEDACGPESGTRYVRTLDDGTIEVLPEPSDCGGLAPFEACPWYGSEEPVDDPALDACGCACAQ